MLLPETRSSWFLDTDGALICKVNTSMEKYTAQQYAQMAGGHAMEQDKPKKFGFVSELNESMMFRTKQKVQGTNAREMGDFAMMNMLALWILYQNYDTRSVAQNYAARTMQYGNFNTYRQAATDLYIALNAIKNGTAGTTPNDKIQNNHFKVNDMQVRNYLRAIAQGQPVANARSFLMRLERGLDVSNSNYRAIRRLAQDWGTINKMQKQLVVTRLLQYFRTKALRSELYSFIRDMARSQKLEIRNAHNAEQPKMRGVDSIRKAAVGAAAGLAGGFAAGYALGKATDRSSDRRRFATGDIS